MTENDVIDAFKKTEEVEEWRKHKTKRREQIMKAEINVDGKPLSLLNFIIKVRPSSPPGEEKTSVDDRVTILLEDENFKKSPFVDIRLDDKSVDELIKALTEIVEWRKENLVGDREIIVRP